MKSSILVLAAALLATADASSTARRMRTRTLHKSQGETVAFGEARELRKLAGREMRKMAEMSMSMSMSMPTPTTLPEVEVTTRSGAMTVGTAVAGLATAGAMMLL